ncbi:MAG: DUF402 domain-containing protein [Clostridia bacterium]|nr:DUF402 domain-containing protein [Clostridia bacterium]
MGASVIYNNIIIVKKQYDGHARHPMYNVQRSKEWFDKIQGTKSHIERQINIRAGLMENTNIENKTYTMKAYKYDGRLHYEQPLQLEGRFRDHLVLSGAGGRKLTHYTRDAVYTFRETSREFFFLDRWYTAALVYGGHGEVQYVYCNIAVPCRITDETVEFVDLDVDVIVRAGRIEVLDMDEFEENRSKYGYEESLVARVLQAVDEVKSDILERAYPFEDVVLNNSKP